MTEEIRKMVETKTIDKLTLYWYEMGGEICPRYIAKAYGLCGDEYIIEDIPNPDHEDRMFKLTHTTPGSGDVRREYFHSSDAAKTSSEVMMRTYIKRQLGLT